jgi:two-component system, NarL family, response regulator LiaR
MTIRIVLADDHVVLRQALRMLLDSEPDLQVVAEAGNGQEAIDAVLDLRPDVVLMDAIMPKLDGIKATEIVHERAHGVRVLILSALQEEETVVAAARAGAIGFVQKSVPIKVLTRSIRAAARGQVQFSPVAAARLVRALNEPIDKPERLTNREREVLVCIVQGLANKQIAWKLGISEKTVKTHVSAILAKFGLESRTQAALHATRLGLVPAGRCHRSCSRVLADSLNRRDFSGASGRGR